MTATAAPRPRLLAAVVLSACVGLVGGAAAAWGIYARFGPVERVITQPINVGSGGSSGLSVAAIADQKSPSVVEVVTQPVVDPQSLLNGGSGIADGFVVSSDGLVMTSIHAIRGASSLRVATADGHLFPAVIVRADPTHGVALLRASGAQGLTALGFATTPARPGDLAVAVARTPFAHLGLSTGTVSSTGRTLQLATGEALVSDVLTVDATAAAHEDGAPLLSGAGDVIGVVVDASGAAPGLIALSGKAAATLVQQASGGGATVTPTLGLSSVVLDATTAAAANLPSGGYILSVVGGGPADAAGLAAGDVVTSCNGVTIDTDHPFDAVSLGLSAQQQVTLTVTRGGVARTVTLVVGSSGSSS
jgi:S1-C subfamily serine protease